MSLVSLWLLEDRLVSMPQSWGKHHGVPGIEPEPALVGWGMEI